MLESYVCLSVQTKENLKFALPLVYGTLQQLQLASKNTRTNQPSVWSFLTFIVQRPVRFLSYFCHICVVFLAASIQMYNFFISFFNKKMKENMSMLCA